jgi:hypothetical protein
MSLSGNSPLLPTWFTKSIIIAIITVVVGGIGAWVGGVNRIVRDAGAVNAVQDEKLEEQDRRTNEIVVELKEIKAVLLDRLPPNKVRYVYVPIKVAEPKTKPKTDEEVLNGQ